MFIISQRYINAVYHTKFICISPRFFLIKRLGGEKEKNIQHTINFLFAQCVCQVTEEVQTKIS